MFSLKAGEQKTIKLTVKNHGRVIDLTGVTLELIIVKDPGTVLVTIPDLDFTRVDVLNGVVSFVMTATHTGTTLGIGEFLGELTSTYPSGSIEISSDIKITIERRLS